MDASADLLKVNHQLESRVPEIGLLGSEGGATSSVVPTPIIVAHRYDLFKMYKLQSPAIYRRPIFKCPSGTYSKRCHRHADTFLLRIPNRLRQMRDRVLRVAVSFSAPATTRLNPIFLC